jgi:integrase
VSEYRVLILFLAYTGVRHGETAGLRVGKLDLLGRRAAISEAWSRSTVTVLSTLKAHHARIVPIPQVLVDDLAKLVDGKAPDDLVFTSPQGGLLHLAILGTRPGPYRR